MSGQSADDDAVLADLASRALEKQEARLEDVRKRALEVVGVAGLVFALFGALRPSASPATWAIVLALAAFVLLAAICVGLQLPGEEWYFHQSVALLRGKHADMIEARKPWSIHRHLADDLETCYNANQPRIDKRLRWLAGALAMLGTIVTFLVVDLIITQHPEQPNGQPAITTTTTTTANSTP